MIRKLLLAYKLFLAGMLLLQAIPAISQSDIATRRAWNQPVKPFRIIGNIYYVGVAEVTSFLITSPKGHILLDSGYEETVPRIQNSVRKLGFRLKDIKILINSHAHFDHAGGFAQLKRLTGAQLMISEADAQLISDGGKSDFAWGGKPSFKAAKVDHTLHDQEEIHLGGVTMVAHITPGHTKGCTSWTMNVREGNKELAVVFMGSTSIPGYRLIKNAKYPTITEDYAHSFERLKSLKCDVFLGPHGSFFSLLEKRARQVRGEKTNPFIDPQGYRDYLKDSESTYLKQLQQEKQSTH